MKLSTILLTTAGVLVLAGTAPAQRGGKRDNDDNRRQEQRDEQRRKNRQEERKEQRARGERRPNGTIRSGQADAVGLGPRTGSEVTPRAEPLPAVGNVGPPGARGEGADAGASRRRQPDVSPPCSFEEVEGTGGDGLGAPFSTVGGSRGSWEAEASGRGSS